MYFCQNAFTTHTHSYIPLVACTLYFRTNKFEVCLGFSSQRRSRKRGSSGRREVQKGLSDPSQSIRKKISRPAHISAPNLVVAQIRVLFPPNPSYISFSHPFLSVLTCFPVSVAPINFFESTSPSLVLSDTGGL